VTDETGLPDPYGVLDRAHAFARSYVDDVDAPVHRPEAAEVLKLLRGPLPEAGMGADEAVRTLLEVAQDAATRSTSSRFFHLVIGGVTPAALAADWVTATIDQNPGMWLASPLGTEAEEVAKAWLLELLQLPASWRGSVTSGATMANFTCLAAAREWAGRRQGGSVADQGLTAFPLVIAMSHVHASALKALAMLGLGRSRVERAADASDLEQRLGAHAGPAIVLCTAGEPNTGAFDAIAELRHVTKAHDAWLHVDGAFGAFARAFSGTAHLVQGLEDADSLALDAHKWLNVPYDIGCAFVARPGLLEDVFGGTPAEYFRDNPEDRPNLSFTGPEMSRRARGLTLWTALAALGRDGVAELVGRHVATASYFGRLVEAHPDLQLLADPQLNIVCFRYRPTDVPEEELDVLNEQVAEELFADGRVYVGTTVYRGCVAFRPAFINWRTSTDDADVLMETFLDVARRATA